MKCLVCGELVCECCSEKMTTQCAWCTCIMDGPYKGTILGYKIADYSHGICDLCKIEWIVTQTVSRIQKVMLRLAP